MGYCITQLNSQFAMDFKDAARALETIKEAVRQDDGLKEYRAVLGMSSLKEAMNVLGWDLDTYVGTSGKYDMINFKEEKYRRTRDELDLIAPYVGAGSYISFVGEEGETFHYFFDGKKCEERDGLPGLPSKPDGPLVSKGAVKKAEQILIDNGIEADEVQTVLQAVGYALLNKELYAA